MQGNGPEHQGRGGAACRHPPDATLEEAIGWRIRLHASADPAEAAAHAAWLSGCPCRSGASAEAQRLWDLLGLALAGDAGKGQA